MKTIEDYLRMNYTMEVIEDPTEGGFVVSFPELPGCLTCGQTLENALANALDAKKAWLEAALEDGLVIQEPKF
ncbi:MAG: type II toxin-antitoxin system HicB family antitoxin [Succinivibrio sp.]|nr:type II toxin-antitoxin system HicB family antitoxin [Succinivibrio sp.]MCI6449202.1 type II toxin-antitoxin system HicB family antitoxin [Succinivibrio sp.]MDY5904106.1 type II toxin-antitoxin system HicB family antitoxin [Succinivibrio sp.]MEE0892272.1 type II toxin-antitoxin system HicB family antitoxin [Succinivibrio sp.]